MDWTAKLVEAASDDDLQSLKDALKNGADINAITDEGYTALNSALNKKVENFLIEAGAKR